MQLENIIKVEKRSRLKSVFLSLLGSYSQCLKITEKVALKNCERSELRLHFAVKQCYQTGRFLYNKNWWKCRN